MEHTLIKLPIKALIENDYNITLDRQQAIDGGYLISQGDSLLFDQIQRLKGKYSEHIDELLLVAARKNPRQEPALRHILDAGFTYNGAHYLRFGKSASQAKEGITAFVCDALFDELYRITQMDIPVEECVLSKYEAQRCLAFSTCSLIHDYMPNIVIIGEYEKTLPNQLIKYVVEKEREFRDEQTGETVSYLSREVEEGFRDIRLSPFDGCGCHEKGFMEKVSAQLGLDYNAAGAQVRLPFMKGYSVYVPFRSILKEWGCETVTDVYGQPHPVESIDCIWNTSMFKGHGLFYSTYGNDAWTEYMRTVRKYEYKLGISKYSHHIRHLDKYTRMNFQYLQCLDLWNPGYIRHFQDRTDDYDILDSSNDSKIVRLAGYTTNLFERIIKGDKFYTYKFMGVAGTEDFEPKSKYLEAILINDEMLRDPAVKQFLYRKLKKSIDEAKIGKIYCSGFYHTGVGDMIGYLQYAAGLEPQGCLDAGEIYSGNFAPGDCVSLRSPLVDPSEVNKLRLARNETTDRWLVHFKDQDIVMYNMHDLSAPQQGGADYDGDIFLISDDPVLIASKIDKRMILDIEDKVTARSRPYTPENLTEYEIMTRDSRIGEITNAATSIENRYTTDEDIKKRYSDYASLLRIYQGKEIDFLKTGLRWNMSGGLRRHMKQLPYFLLYHYPQKMKTYLSLRRSKAPLNAYHSPSPMNELCDYICAWEKRNILWDSPIANLADTARLVVNHTLELTDRGTMRICRRYINDYAAYIKETVQRKEAFSFRCHEETVKRFRESLEKTLGLDETAAANYVIRVSYNSLSISKSFAWAAYGDYILDNLRANSGPQRNLTIREIPGRSEDCYEYLGKYYEFREGGTYVRTG